MVLLTPLVSHVLTCWRSHLDSGAEGCGCDDLAAGVHRLRKGLGDLNACALSLGVCLHSKTGCVWKSLHPKARRSGVRLRAGRRLANDNLCARRSCNRQTGLRSRSACQWWQRLRSFLRRLFGITLNVPMITNLLRTLHPDILRIRAHLYSLLSFPTSDINLHHLRYLPSTCVVLQQIESLLHLLSLLLVITDEIKALEHCLEKQDSCR